MHRSLAVLVTLACCRLTFCHVLATAGPNPTWSTGGDTYLAQTFAREWHCDASQCWLAKEPATGVSGVLFLGIELFALCALCTCILLAHAPTSVHVAATLAAFGCLGLVTDVIEGARPALAIWLIALCVVASGFLALRSSEANRDDAIPRAAAKR